MVVIVSGGDPQRIGTTEAELMTTELIKLGVPLEHIREEDKARHTIENAVFVCKYIIEATMPSVTDIHVVRWLSDTLALMYGVSTWCNVDALSPHLATQSAFLPEASHVLLKTQCQPYSTISMCALPH